MYRYGDHRPYVFTEDGQIKFLKIRDKAHMLIKMAGSATMGALIFDEVGVNWETMACVDRLVEIGELKEVDHGECAGQDRIFKRI